jgi:hypothetical protein
MDGREPLSERLWWLWAFVVGPLVFVAGLVLLGWILGWLAPGVEMSGVSR